MVTLHKCSSSPPRRQDSLYSCLVCFSATVSNMTSLGCLFSFGFLFVALLEKYGDSRQKTAWIGSMSFCFSALLGPLASLILKKLSCRVLSIIGNVMIMVGFFTSSYVTEMDYLFFTYGFLSGCGLSFINIANNVVLAKYFRKYRSLSYSALAVGASIGYLSVNQIVYHLLKATSLITCFQIMSALHLIPCLLSFTFDPNIETDCGESEQHHDNKELREESLNTTYFSVFKNYPVVLFLIAWFFFEVGHVIPLVHLVQHCQDLGITKEKGADLYICFGVSGIFGRILAGTVADILHINRVLIILYGSLYPLGISTLLLPLLKSYEGLIFYMILFGLLEGAAIASYICALYDLAGPKQHTQAVGLAFFSIAIPSALSPPFAGFLADQTGSYDSSFYFAGSIFILSGLTLQLILCFKTISSKEDIEIVSYSENGILVVEKETVL